MAIDFNHSSDNITPTSGSLTISGNLIGVFPALDSANANVSILFGIDAK